MFFVHAANALNTEKRAAKIVLAVRKTKWQKGIQAWNFVQSLFKRN